MSNGTEYTYISQADYDRVIDSPTPPPGSGLSQAEWSSMSASKGVWLTAYYEERNVRVGTPPPPDYLGGYVAPLVPQPGMPYGAMRPDPYLQGDEFNLFTNRSSAWIANLQDRMVNAGLLKESQIYRFGQWTSTEAAKMRGILALANETGTDWSQVLNNYSERDSGGGTPLPAKLVENEDELTARLQESLPGLTGGNFLPESDARAIARAYRDYLSAKGDEVARGGTVEKAMSFDTFVKKQEGIEDEMTANRFSLLTSAMGQLNKA